MLQIYITPQITLKLHGNVLPTFTYGAELWCKPERFNVPKEQLKYLKYILGIKDSTCSLPVCESFGDFQFTLLMLKHKTQSLITIPS